MVNGFEPVQRQSLADGLAQRIKQLIHEGGYGAGDRLPAINEMARRFGVGHPTLREALKKLETVGTVDIRHGSGVYVGKNQDALVVSNPVYGGTVSKKLLVDLMDARIPVEQVFMICVAMGWPDGDFPANAVVSKRKGVDEAVRFVGFDD